MVEGCSIWVRFGFWPVRLDPARLLFIPLLALGAWCWLCEPKIRPSYLFPKDTHTSDNHEPQAPALLVLLLGWHPTATGTTV